MAQPDQRRSSMKEKFAVLFAAILGLLSFVAGVQFLLLDAAGSDAVALSYFLWGVIMTLLSVSIWFRNSKN
ncbi:MAG: hypothetical protein R3346_02540 [Candidatus Spechtbacterales bacterium]|nr:hypothetical protein [Candidatus Spechtbacterales bacterium]